MTARASNAVGVGVIGAGLISGQYLANLTQFPDVIVHAVADIDEDRARAQAAKYAVPLGGAIDAVLSHPDVELVVNITIPAVHVSVSTAILESGKHVWTEKPLAIDRESGRLLLDLAEARGKRIGSAPDTILGQGLQSAQRLIERGDIGTPLSAVTLMQDPGVELWHPNPDFVYAKGAGPLFDRGPYYYAMLVQFFGPFDAVAAVGTKATETRTVGSGPRAGQVFPVEVFTNVQVISRFTGGQVAQSAYSYESPFKRHGWVEISGTEGAIRVPDPNYFTGEIGLTAYGSGSWTTIPAPRFDAERGTGVVDMARSIRSGRPHRASAELGYHVLDAMIATEESLTTRSMVTVGSSAPRLEPLPEDWDPFAATL